MGKKKTGNRKHGAKAQEAKQPRPSGLHAAAQILKEAGEPLDCATIVQRALEKGLWKTQGKTPAATLNASIHREIAKQGEQSRFVKAERGRFTLVS